MADTLPPTSFIQHKFEPTDDAWRSLFAALAMQGILTGLYKQISQTSKIGEISPNMEAVASAAFDVAEAMMRERHRRQESSHA